MGGNVRLLTTIEIKALLKAAGKKINGRGAPKKRNQLIAALKALIRESLLAYLHIAIRGAPRASLTWLVRVLRLSASVSVEHSASATATATAEAAPTLGVPVPPAENSSDEAAEEQATGEPVDELSAVEPSGPPPADDAPAAPAPAPADEAPAAAEAPPAAEAQPAVEAPPVTEAPPAIVAPPAVDAPSAAGPVPPAEEKPAEPVMAPAEATLNGASEPSPSAAPVPAAPVPAAPVLPEPEVGMAPISSMVS